MSDTGIVWSIAMACIACACWAYLHQQPRSDTPTVPSESVLGNLLADYLVLPVMQIVVFVALVLSYLVPVIGLVLIIRWAWFL